MYPFSQPRTFAEKFASTGLKAANLGYNLASSYYKNYRVYNGIKQSIYGNKLNMPPVSNKRKLSISQGTPRSVRAKLLSIADSSKKSSGKSSAKRLLAKAKSQIRRKKMKYSQSSRTRPQVSFVRKGKKPAKKTLMTKGVKAMIEKSGVVLAGECAYLGHHNAPYDLYGKQLFRAMVKAIAMEQSISIPSFNDVAVGAPYYYAAGDIFRLQYYPNQTTNSLLAIDYTIAAGNTFQQIADGWFAVWSAGAGVPGPGNSPLNWRYSHIQYFHGAQNHPPRYVKINLPTAGFTIICDSQLKVQNRTIPGTGRNDSEDVANVPLTGQSYEVKGNTFLNVRTRELFCADNNGVIAFGVSANVSSLSEPPPAAMFKNCKGTGKVMMQPGDIKTSRLYNMYKWSFEKAFYISATYLSLGDTTGSPTRLYQPNLGQSRLFSLEKMIRGDAESVTLSYEQQFDMSTVFTYKKSSITEPIVAQS